jgi:hypothetical protein
MGSEECDRKWRNIHKDQERTQNKNDEGGSSAWQGINPKVGPTNTHHLQADVCIAVGLGKRVRAGRSVSRSCVWCVGGHGQSA